MSDDERAIRDLIAKWMAASRDGDWAYLRNDLQISVTPPGGQPVTRAGYPLTTPRKLPDGTWRPARDANLLAAQT